MELEVLWQQKQYNEIYRRIQSCSPEEVPEAERAICAQVMLRNGRRQEALAFYKAANTSVMTQGQKTQYASLLDEDGQVERAYELLKSAPCSEFEALHQLYCLEKKMDCSEEERLETLGQLLEISYQEDLLYDQAMLYYRTGQAGRGRRACRQLISYYGNGSWAEKAQLLMEDPERVLREEADACVLVSNPPVVPKAQPEQKPQASDVVITQPKTAAKPVEKPEKQTYPAIIEEAFAGMIGMDSVKQELTGFYNMICLQKARKEMLGISDDSARAYNFVLYGNPGTGKTTVARIIAKVLYALGIRENDTLAETDRSKLVGQYIGETAQKTKAVIESARGGTLFVDEAYALMAKDDNKDYGKEAVDTLLKDMEDNRDAYSVILAGYKEPMGQMLKMNPGFQSRFNYHITIPDYTDDELIEIARRNATDKHYTISESAEAVIRKCILRERIDETFGNARYIRELINKAEINLANRLAQASGIRSEEMSVLTGADFLPGKQEELPIEALLEELNSLTGLGSVKEMVQNLLSVIQVRKEAERRGLPIAAGFGTLHMAFRGNPGTGKTTVARILGQLLNRMGVLKRDGIFVECSRAELVGQYQGHTAQKVKDTVASALGGVLFVDEAYSLVKNPDDQFGLEAVDTLIAEMENHKNDFVVILAGYSDQLDQFLESNPGFSSRINLHLTFEDYSVQEMTRIFAQMTRKQKLLLDDALLPMVHSVLEKISQKQNFGNARGVRNFFETVCRCKDARVAQMLMSGQAIADAALITITEPDIAKAGDMLG